MCASCQDVVPQAPARAPSHAAHPPGPSPMQHILKARKVQAQRLAIDNSFKESTCFSTAPEPTEDPALIHWTYARPASTYLNLTRFQDLTLRTSVWN